MSRKLLSVLLILTICVSLGLSGASRLWRAGKVERLHKILYVPAVANEETDPHEEMEEVHEEDEKKNRRKKLRKWRLKRIV